LTLIALKGIFRWNNFFGRRAQNICTQVASRNLDQNRDLLATRKPKIDRTAHYNNGYYN